MNALVTFAAFSTSQCDVGRAHGAGAIGETYKEHVGTRQVWEALINFCPARRALPNDASLVKNHPGPRLRGSWRKFRSYANAIAIGANLEVEGSRSTPRVAFRAS